LFANFHGENTNNATCVKTTSWVQTLLLVQSIELYLFLLDKWTCWVLHENFHKYGPK
jgi:hypothetical protein